MLETKELTKIYRTKKGVTVTALDKVSIRFPETGMVFLLGKSGSGKSTLLNLLGGLDSYNSGEILIKGVSSKNFKQQHFDSYRNTYIGFIFQEYNVLDEFSVGANIALAIELQDRKASDDEINKILHEVDLDGFGSRKPSELSGGQKQRVAIARALVKNPEIIMADEPTGALDSATGKQVFDTLKKLSKDKLIIVVSHDREFAENYADRIIELSDGRIISDMEYINDDAAKLIAESIVFSGNTVDVAPGYHLTEEDRIKINEYIDSIKSDGISIKISNKNITGKTARATDTSKIIYKDDGGFRLIKSKLPTRNAFKIGANNLKYKKIRLVITIFLSCIAFGLFGLSDTFGSYNHIKTCTKSIIDTGVPYASVQKEKKFTTGNGNYYFSNYGYHLNDDELNEIKSKTGITMKGVYQPRNHYELDFTSAYDNDAKFTETDYHIYAYSLNGFAEISQEELDNIGYDVIAGTLPNGANNEIGISKYACETFLIGGYSDGTTYVNEEGKTVPKFTAVNSYSDMVGKVLKLNGINYTVTCIIDTKFDLSRYEDLTKKDDTKNSSEKLIDFALYNELSYERDYSLNQVAFVGSGFIEKFSKKQANVKTLTDISVSFNIKDGDGFCPNYLGTIDDVGADSIIWINESKDSLSDKEIILSADLAQTIALQQGLYDSITPSAEMFSDKEVDTEGEIMDAKHITGIAKLLVNSKTYRLHSYSIDGDTEEDGYKVVGIVNSEKYPDLSNSVICSKTMCEKYVDINDGFYNYAVGAMPSERSDVDNLVKYCYNEESDVRYKLMNSVTFELDAVNDVLATLSKVFLYIGIGFAVFAALMLANFISTSINYKKREIGILRAIGSRSLDVFRIFFAESFIIAMINFVLSAIGVGVATYYINYVIRKNVGILITVLGFGIRQIIFLLLLSMFIAAIASFIPVKRIASKRPIDAIRDR